MKYTKAFSFLAIMAAFACITPAQAQYGYGSGYGWNPNIDAMQAQLQQRINQGISNGRLNQREAARLQAKMSNLNTIEARMRMSGNRLSRGERNSLQRRIASLSQEISRDLRDFERRRIGWNRGGGWR